MAENVQTEINFGKYNPEIDGIRVTGKVDKIVFTDEKKQAVRIVDYKSGKPKAITNTIWTPYSPRYPIQS